MRCPRRLAAVAPLLLLAGCATAKLQSVVRKDYGKTLDRVFVLAATQDRDSVMYLNGLKDPLSRRLAEAGAVNKVHVYDFLRLDEKELVKQEMAELQPRFILEISLLSKTDFKGSTQGATFELKLSEIGEEAPVWKAQLSTVSGYPAGEASAESTSQEILDQLTRDGLVKARTPPKN